MITVTYENETVIDEIDAEKTLLDISLENNIPHVHACGGHARCSTCRVAVVQNLENCEPRNEAECELARNKGLDSNIRLACQTRVTGPVTIRRLVIDDEDARDASQTSNSGQEKQLAILFSDIRSFTPFTEKNLPYDVVHVMNRYFRRMGDSIQRYNGYIDKYIGDGMMALFGLNESATDTLELTNAEQRAQNARIVCRNAVLSALDMQKELVDVNRYLHHHLDHEFHIGVGVHFGDVIVGEMGHPDKRQFTALGDNVNTASRIEAVTKKAKVPFLISQEVHSILEEDLTVYKRFRTKLKGKSGDYRLFAVTAVRDPEAQSRPTAPAKKETTAVTPKPSMNTSASARPVLKRLELPILEIRTVAEQTLAFLLDTSQLTDFEFVPGQYVNVQIPGVQGVRTFSIASASRIKDFILIATRIRNSDFKQHMQKLQPGDTLRVGSPEGTLSLPGDRTRPIIFIAGGIGITPIRSMIEEMIDSQVDRPILLFYANRTPEASAFVPELQEWLNHMPNARFVPIYSRTLVAGAEQGRLDGNLIRKYVTEFETSLREHNSETQAPLYYVVGPDSMTLDTVGLLEKEGIPADRIILEAFYGYQ